MKGLLRFAIMVDADFQPLNKRPSLCPRSHEAVYQGNTSVDIFNEICSIYQNVKTSLWVSRAEFPHVSAHPPIYGTVPGKAGVAPRRPFRTILYRNPWVPL